jgi:hypothetical protein
MGNRNYRGDSVVGRQDAAYGVGAGQINTANKMAEECSRKQALTTELRKEEDHAQRQRDGKNLLNNLQDPHCAIQDQLSNELFAWFKHQGFWPEWWHPADATGEQQLMTTNRDAQDQRMVTIPFVEYVRLKKMEKLGLVVTEVAEAMEAVRKGDVENEKEEIADIEVRLHDYKGGFGLTRLFLAFTPTAAEAFIDKMKKNFARPFRHGKKF